MSAGLAMGLFTAGMSIWGAGKQAAHEKDIADLEYKSDLEDIRRRDFEQQQIKGQAKAFSEASGVLHSGGSTAQGYLNTMESQFKRELEFMKKYAEESRRLGYEGASLRKTANVFDALGAGFSVYGSMK